jgi:hypothetical protein
MVEDSFAKARKAFFGTATTVPKPSGLQPSSLEPRNEATAERESSGPREAGALKFR